MAGMFIWAIYGRFQVDPIRKITRKKTSRSIQGSWENTFCSGYGQGQNDARTMFFIITVIIIITNEYLHPVIYK